MSTSDRQAHVPPVAGPDLRLVPPALAAWAGMAVATSGFLPLIALGCLAGIVVAGWGWGRRSWALAATGLVLLTCVSTGALRVWAVQGDSLHQLAGERAVVTIEARVVGNARRGDPSGVRPAWWMTQAELVGLEGRGTAFRGGGTVELSATGALVPAWAGVSAGSVVRTTVRLEAAQPGDVSTALARAREPPKVVESPGPADAFVDQVRAGLRDAVRDLAPEPRALLPALVFGDTASLPADLVNKFKVTGLTHLTAVSGENLVLLSGFLVAMARLLGVRGWWLRGVLLVGVVVFVLLCRAEPSVVRAAAMGLVALAGLGWSRAGAALRPLCAAVIAVVVWDPGMARSLGFVLSVLACAGIVVWGRPWMEALGRWLPGWLAEPLAVSLAAQFATEPVVVALAGQVSLVSVLANLVAGPLVGPATVLGFLVAGLSLVAPPLAVACGWLAGWCAQGLVWTAELGALVPGAAFAWPATPVGVALVTLVCLAAGLVLRRALVRPALALGLVLVLCFVLLRPPAPPGWPPEGWLVAFCDIGQGDATLLRAGEADAVLVDTGPDPRPLARCLRELGVERLPLVVLTHFHADHIGGLSAVTDGFAVQQLLVSGSTSPPSGYREVVALAGGIERTVATAGVVVSVGAVRVTVLAARPVEPAVAVDEGESAVENDSSLVMRAQVGLVSVLLGGDVQEDGQRNALATAADLRARILLVPHHGSTHQDPDYLAASHADLAVFSVGKDNDYGHPAARTVQAVQSLGMSTARTDQQGSLALSLDASGHLVLTSQR